MEEKLPPDVGVWEDWIWFPVACPGMKFSPHGMPKKESFTPEM